MLLAISEQAIMADSLSRERRSWNMSRIRGGDTLPELIVRRFLHRAGFRFRLHSKKLPGRPDIVLPKHRTVVLVHGCFWHRHASCKMAYQPKSNNAFWNSKFDENIKRDHLVRGSLRKLGWTVITVWQCQTTNLRSLRKALEPLSRIRSAHRMGEKRGRTNDRC